MEQFAKYGKFLTPEMIAKLEVPRTTSGWTVDHKVYPSVIDPAVLTDFLILGQIFRDAVDPIEGSSLIPDRWNRALKNLVSGVFHELHDEPLNDSNTWVVVHGQSICREPIKLYDNVIELFMIRLCNKDIFITELINSEKFEGFHPFIAFLYVVEGLAAIPKPE